MKFKIACGTNNGEEFTEEHFGDSEFFLIYECDSSSQNIVFLEKRNNNSEEEEKHGDPKKAQGISAILKDVPVLLAFAMGPNIVRMRKKFVPVISREKKIEKSLEKIKNVIPKIVEEIKKSPGEDREVFIID